MKEAEEACKAAEQGDYWALRRLMNTLYITRLMKQKKIGALKKQEGSWFVEAKDSRLKRIRMPVIFSLRTLFTSCQVQLTSANIHRTNHRSLPNGPLSTAGRAINANLAIKNCAFIEPAASELCLLPTLGPLRDGTAQFCVTTVYLQTKKFIRGVGSPTRPGALRLGANRLSEEILQQIRILC